jgi:hypothetical protein
VQDQRAAFGEQRPGQREIRGSGFSGRPLMQLWPFSNLFVPLRNNLIPNPNQSGSGKMMSMVRIFDPFMVKKSDPPRDFIRFFPPFPG